MKVAAIADLHGAVDRLDAVASECDALLVLGDLINVLDYRTMDGILVEVFGRGPVAEAAEARAAASEDFPVPPFPDTRTMSCSNSSPQRMGGHYTEPDAAIGYP